MTELQDALKAGDFFGVIENLQRGGAPVEVASRYAAAMRDLYWKAHDLPAVVAIGRAGILYCLGQSLTSDQTELIDKLRSAAKALAYDVGSFTWPGWEEPGIDPRPEDLRAGRECAKLNLRLAIELSKPAGKVAMAYWLVGAHALAALDSASAQTGFRAALDITDAAGDASSSAAIHLQGCLAVAQLCSVADSAGARREFEQIISQLQDRTDDESKAYLSQLRSALKLFTKVR